MGRNFYVPFSFVVSVHTKKHEITRDQRNKICLEWPHVPRMASCASNGLVCPHVPQMASCASNGLVCLEWPRVQQIDQLYREFVHFFKFQKAEYFAPKARYRGKSSISHPKALPVMLTPIVTSNLTAQRVYTQVSSSHSKIYNVNCEKLNVAIHINV